MRIKTFIAQNKEILILLLIYAVLYSFNLDKFPVISGDENYFLNPAYDLVMFGKMGTSMIYGFYNIANFTYWQPPVFILLMAASFKLFGFGIVQARMVSVFLGFLTVLFTYLLGLKLYNKKIGLLASFLLVLNPLFFLVSRTARMEIAVACFMVIALYFTVLALKYSKVNYYFVSGLFATLAVLSHPNGVIAVLVVVMVILAEKIDIKSFKFKFNLNKVLAFILGVLIPLIPYLLYISMDFTAFKGQFMMNVGASPSNPLNNIIMEPSRFVELFWWFVRYDGVFLTFVTFAVALILTVLGLYYLVMERKLGDKFLLIVFMVTAVVFSIFVYHKYFIYLGLIAPYFSILIALTLKDKITLQLNKKGVCSVFILVLWIALIIGNCIFIDNFLEKTKDYDYYSIGSEVEKYIPAGSVVMGDHNYWIALHDKYRYYGRETGNKTSSMLVDLNIQYILFDNYWGNGNIWTSEDKYIENYVNQNCTLIGVIPANDSNGFVMTEIYRVNNKS